MPTATTRPMRQCRLQPKKKVYEVESDWEAVDDQDAGDWSTDDGWDASDTSSVSIRTESEYLSEDDEEADDRPRTKDGYVKDDFVASDSELDVEEMNVSESESSAASSDLSDASDISLRGLVIDSSSEEDEDDE